MKRKILNKSIDELEKILQKEYLRLSDKLMSYLLNLYIDIIDEGDTPLHSHLYQYNKYYEMLNKVQDELTKLGIKENRIFDDRLVHLYEDNCKIIEDQFNLANDIRQKDVLSIVKTDWVGDGSNYSDRIWKDKRRLAETIQEEVTECVATGKSPEKFTKVLMERFNVSYNNARRLARTEMAHVYNQSTLDKYKEAGITRVQILETDDAHTCEECRKLNKKIFPINEVPELPIHPNCRGTYLAVID